MKSVLTINGNDPKALLNSTLYGADAMMYDLYEAVGDDNKDAARILMQEALSFFDFGDACVFVRVNRLCCCGLDDIAVVGKGKPCAFVIPRASVENIAKAEAAIAAVEAENGFDAGSIKIIPSIETVAGVENVAAIAAASPRVSAVIFNGCGFLKDLGVACACDSDQFLYARSKISMACHMAGVPALDTPFPDLKNTEGLKADAAKAKALGFAGKVAAGGGQVPAINAVFA